MKPPQSIASNITLSFDEMGTPVRALSFRFLHPKNGTNLPPEALIHSHIQTQLYGESSMSIQLPKLIRTTTLILVYTAAAIAASFAWGNLPTTSAYSFEDILTDPMLTVSDRPTIDPGIVSSRSVTTVSGSASTNVTDAYPGPSMRGYPAPNPIMSLTLKHDKIGKLTATLKSLLALITFSPGTTEQDFEVQLYELTNLASQFEAQLIGLAFSIQAFTKDGQPIERFNKPYTVVLSYDDSSMQKGDEEALRLFQWDYSKNSWVEIEADINMEANEISAIIGQSAELALIGRSHLYLPAIQH